ncbi:unnamed protein product, partial [Rotaria magnacalcarata]
STYATNGSNLILTCPKGTSLQQLPSLPSDPQWYTQFTSFLAQGENDTRGPFTTIPLDICLFSNLTVSLCHLFCIHALRTFNLYLDTQLGI